MSRPIAYILLLVVLWCQDQTTADRKNCSLMRLHRCAKNPAKCPKWVINFCNTRIKCRGPYAHLCTGTNRKRTDIDDGLPQKINPNAVYGERREIQEAREGDGREGGGWGSGRGGERRSDGFGGSREGGDDLRSEFNDRRRQQMSDERQLVDIGNDRRGHSLRSAQLDSVIGRLRSLLGTTDLQDVDDRGEEEGKREERQEEKEEEEEEEPQEHSNIDTDQGCNETQILLNEILADIESRFDTQPATNSVSED